MEKVKSTVSKELEKAKEAQANDDTDDDDDEDLEAKEAEWLAEELAKRTAGQNIRLAEMYSRWGKLICLSLRKHEALQNERNEVYKVLREGIRKSRECNKKMLEISPRYESFVKLLDFSPELVVIETEHAPYVRSQNKKCCGCGLTWFENAEDLMDIHGDTDKLIRKYTDHPNDDCTYEPDPATIELFCMQHDKILVLRDYVLIINATGSKKKNNLANMMTVR
eukprot:SAG31_NODE_194_length_20722_cov_19.854192_4_plen_223_part_00